MRRRNRLAIALVAATTLVAGACGGDDPSSSSATTAAGATATSAAGAGTEPAAFPVSIENKFGTTELDAAPERVVSVGFSDQDLLLALDVVPVGIRDWYGDQPDATWPWAHDALGGAKPTLLDAGELNIEAVAALQPDLIVGMSSGMTQEQYDLLAAIAPTLAQPAEFPDYGVPWQDGLLLVGQAVGKADQAEAIIADIEARYAEVRQSNPEFAGKSAAVAFVFDGLPGAYASTDPRSRFLTDLGFEIPAKFDELAGDQFFTSFSAEQVGLLDLDTVVWLAADEMEMSAVESLPGRTQLGVYQRGGEVFADEMLSGAFSFSSPLSIPILLDELVPMLADAVAGKGAAGGAATTTPAGTATTAAVAMTAEEQAAADAYELVFDSNADIAAKSAYLADAAALTPTLEAYKAAGSAMGGIKLDVTTVAVSGDSATTTYDVLFGSTAAYKALSGTIRKTGGTWTVSREDFCSFMASARTPCS